jgi:hypothetical protein
VVTGRRVLFRYLFAAGIAAAGGSLALADERDVEALPIERLRFNLLANSALVSDAVEANVPLPQWVTISGVTNAAPIEVRTPIGHRLATGESVLVKGVLGNVAANGWWTVTVTSETTFTLDGSLGSGEFGGGGAVFPAAGQPPPPGAPDAEGDLPWTPWFSAPAVARETEFFQPNGEIFTFPETPPVNSFLTQEIDGSLFRPGESLCLSIEARMPEPPLGDQRLKMVVTAALGATSVYAGTYPAENLTPEYQRIGMCFRLPFGAITSGGVVRVEFIDEHLRGIPKPMIWARPLLNEGVLPGLWTPNVEPRAPRTHAFRQEIASFQSVSGWKESCSWSGGEKKP